MNGRRQLLLAFSVIQIILPLFCVLDSRAERLPVRIYTSADGLGSSFINYIMRDSRGFMWFCTRDGLSRFDGSRFVNYRIGGEDSPPGIESVYETRGGDYWVTTTGGLFRFKPDAIPVSDRQNSILSSLNAEFVNGMRGEMLEDSRGILWFIVGRDIYNIRERDGKIIFEEVDLNLPVQPNRSFGVADILEAPDASIWLNTSWGAVRHLPDGRIIFYEGETQNTGGNLSMIIAADGRVWLSRALELYIFKPEPIESLEFAGQISVRPLRGTYAMPGNTETEVRLPEAPDEILYMTGGDFLSRYYGKGLYQTTDGRVWLSTDRQLVEFDGRVFRRYDVSQGFAYGLSRIVEDAAGNLWIGGRNGLMRLDRKGFTSYGTADGFKSDSIHAISETPDGALYFADSEFNLTRFDGKKFLPARPPIPTTSAFLWTSRFALLDSRGEWWILTNEKLYRFAASNLNQPLATYDAADGLKGNAMFQIFEDSRGDIWVSTKPTGDEGIGLSRFNRTENRFQTFSEAEGFPLKKAVSSFVEDRHGNLWLGFYQSGVARYRDGRFTIFSEGLPETGLISDLHIDRTGRLWLASSDGGLFRLDDTNSAQPQFVKFSASNGLSSNNIRTITEDKFGRIYLGTVRGVDRLTPETNRVKHYSILDGLAADFVTDSHSDKNGNLWFATMGGLSRLVPTPDETTAPPPVFVGGLRIAGVQQPVSQLGDAGIEKGALAHTENNFQIEFFGLDFRAGENLRYQYRLEGADADWSEPTDSRTVTYANLQPGNYRFLVRAINSDGAASENPAVVSFKILPPVWARWWFALLSAAAIFLIFFLFYRYRTARLREINAALTEANRAEEELLQAREERLAELEKVRSRIATDLHDDIGASLTQIAILSEVARQQNKKGDGTIAQPLRMISTVSNELVETMSDIVWSINPGKDHLSDLTQRMRRFASDVLSPKDINLIFHSPDADKEITLNTNLRREVFLIFKEAINNIVKHSGATETRVEMEISARYLTLEISDDGKGMSERSAAADELTQQNQVAAVKPENSISNFHLSAAADGSDSSDGNGISNMKKRAREMNGVLNVFSNESGTIINLRLPLI